MASKLHINVAQGIIDVEGDEDLVREIYSDFRERILENFASGQEETVSDKGGAGKPENGSEDSGSRRTPTTRRRRTRRRKEAEGSTTGAPDAYVPTLLKDLPLSGLKEFYEQFEPRNHPEKILIFAKFLQDQGHDTCTADQIYTCYATLKERLPKVYLQAFRDAHGRRRGYIDYESPDSIRVTHIGENHFNHELKKKSGS